MTEAELRAKIAELRAARATPPKPAPKPAARPAAAVKPKPAGKPKGKGRPSILVAVAQFDEVNLEIARVFLAEPERYAGGRLEWARLFMARWERQRERTRTTLFEM